MSLILSGLRRSQPTSVARIAEGNPLADQLLGLLVANQHSSRMLVPLSGTSSGNGYGIDGLSRRVHSGGVFQAHGGGGYSNGCMFNNTVYLNRVTLFGLFYKTGAGAGTIFSVSGSSGEEDGRVELNSDGTLRFLANGDVNITTSETVPNGLFTVVLVNDRIVGSQRLYIGGVKTATDGNSTAQTGFGAQWIGTGGSSSGDFSVGLVGCASLAWSDAKVAAFSANPWQIFKAPFHKICLSTASVSLPTLGHPAGDTSAGAWAPSVGTNLYSCIDEVTPDAGDYISVGMPSTCEFALNNTNFPTGAVAVKYRASSVAGSTLTVTLKQGATTIATWTHALTGTDTSYSQTLTGPQKATIADGPMSVSMAVS